MLAEVIAQFAACERSKLILCLPVSRTLPLCWN